VEEKVTIRLITQATTATFADLYIHLTFLFFVQVGSKRVITPSQGEVIGEEGDLLVFPPGSVVTMENRPILDASYRAVGVSFTDDLIASVFADTPKMADQSAIQRIPAEPDAPMSILSIIQATLEDQTLPAAIRNHRLLEPLIWLRERGITLPLASEDLPLSKVRRIIETDLTYEWRASDVASQLAMSEATMRRWLSKNGQSFSKILLNTRLEHGLASLQTTDISISNIALDCGFKTPAHFSDAFKRRFGIQPREIRISST